MSPNLRADHSLLDGKRQGVEVFAAKREYRVNQCLLSGWKTLVDE